MSSLFGDDEEGRAALSALRKQTRAKLAIMRQVILDSILEKQKEKTTWQKKVEKKVVKRARAVANN